jgi:flagellar M-ring protein FliF
MLAQITQFWTNLSFTGKAIYGGSAALLLSLVAGVGYWSSQTQYAVLFSKLQTEDAAAIVQKLDADRAVYKLTSDGTTILVPSEKVQNVRMNLAVAGLPQGAGKGYELFDTMSMGATPFVQNMNYVRAIQGELARTIMQLEPVAHARVHIVQPEPTPFVREEKPVTASVVIKTKPGASLSRSATAGIVALTAGSVKGLSPENVTVLDSDGRVLSEKRDQRGGMASSDQLSYQREVESHLADNAQEILARLLGPGRAVVRVTAEMSFRHLKQTSEKFDPDGKVILRESVMSSKSTAGAGARGPAGAISNIPPGQPNGPAVAGPNKNDETIESEYAVSKTNHSQEEQQGAIDRMTVAVMLIPPERSGDVPLEEALGITPEEARELVKQAVGFKEGRDKIQVSIGKVPVDPPVEAVAANEGLLAKLPFGPNFVSLLKKSSLGIAGLMTIAIVVLATRKRSASGATPSPAYAGLNASASAGADELSDLHAVAATIKAWLEDPATIRFDRKAGAETRARPA